MAWFCPACGNSLTAEDRFCRVCGRGVSSASPAPAPGAPPRAPIGPVTTSGKAIVSLASGLLFFVPLAFIAAIVFGHLGLSEIRKSAGRLKGEGMAVAGLVLGYLWIAGIPIILMIAAIAIPNLLRARMAANEASAVGSVRTLNVAQVSYANSHRDLGFTCSLSDLERDGLIAGELAGGSKSGYAFKLTDCLVGVEGTGNAKYRVVAYPVTANATGVRAFCSDESGVVRVDSGGSVRGCLEHGGAMP